MTWVVGVSTGVLLAIVLTAAVPQRHRVFASHAAPAREYADAITRVGQQQDADDLVAAPGGRSVLLSHGRKAARVVVLFHGFTDSPKQYEHFAPRLYAAGDNVYIPRLPHHGELHGTAASLTGLTADELRRYADAAVDIAGGLGDSVIVAGVSAGGTVAVWVAQYRPDVRRAVIVAPLLEIGRVPSLFASSLVNLALRLPNITDRQAADPARPDREPGFSTRAIAQLLLFGAAARDAASRTPPLVRDIVFLMNANDHTVKTSPAVALARQWAGTGASVVVYQFPRSLGLPHDIAEEAHPNADTAVVYPALEALIHGVRPPPVLADHRLASLRDP